jgi:vitamin B12 transporter
MSPKLSSRLMALSSTFSLLIPTLATAQDIPSERTLATDEIVVIASRYEQPLSQVGASVSVISETDLTEGQYTFVLDALETLPGVSISQTGAFGGVASVNIRGALGDRTKVMIDGIEVNDASSPGGAFNFGNLDPFGVARIEVLRGPQSIMYGSNAMGGVINIVTPSGSEGFEAGAFLEGGSYSTVRGGATLRGGLEKVFFNLSAVASHTDGISAADANDGNAEADGHQNISTNGKLTILPTENSTLEFFIRYADSETETDGFGPVDADNSATSKELSFAGRVSVDFLDGRFQNSLTVGHSSMDRASLSGDFVFPGKGERFNVDYLGVFEVNDAWTVSAGFEHDKSEAKTASDSSFTINSVFGEIGFTGVEGLTLTAGVRYDDHDSYGGVTTARVTGSYQIPNTKTRLKGTWGEGFKAPTIYQLTYVCTFCGLTEPNSDLRPEQAESWEIGIEQYLAHDRVRLGATYFDQQIDDMIIFTFSAGYANVESARSRGVEVSAEALVTDTLTFTASYTYTDAIDRLTGDQLIRTPTHLVAASIRWQATQALLVGANIIYNGDTVDFGGTPLDDWVRVDLTLSYTLNESFTLYGRIDNLFDEQYQRVTGYGTPGLSAFGGVRAAF